MKNGFTLIELLVVITIIVVLLSLLTPALDRAIYQAELAVCAANMRTIGGAATVYCVANKRRYPNRKFVEIQATGATPNLLSNYYPYNDEPYNQTDESIMRGHVGRINGSLSCPLNVEADYELSLATKESAIWVGYDLFFGWGFLQEQGMMKLGDRMSYEGVQFNVLVSDNERQADPLGISIQAHPDYNGALAPRLYQDENGYSAGAFFGFNVGAIPITDGRWEGTHLRGPLDRNFALQNGSVLMLDRLVVGNMYDEREPRVAPIPDTLDKSLQPDVTDNLPRD